MVPPLRGMGEWGNGGMGEVFARVYFSPTSLIFQILQNQFPQIQSDLNQLQVLTEQGIPLIRALDQIPVSAEERVRTHVGDILLPLLSLSREEVPEIFLEELFNLGQRQENQDHLQFAALIYTILSSPIPPFSHSPHLLREAAVRLQTLQNQGSFWDQVEVHARRFIRQAMNPVMLGTFVASGGVSGLARYSMGTWLTRSLAPAFWTRGWMAEAVAGGTAYLSEVFSFIGARRFLNWAVHGTESSEPEVESELIGTGLFIGALKFSQIFHPLGATASLLGGIYLGHRLEEAYGSRPPAPDETHRWLDVFHTALQIRASGRLLPHLPSLPRTNFENSSIRPIEEMISGFSRVLDPLTPAPVGAGERLVNAPLFAVAHSRPQAELARSFESRFRGDEAHPYNEEIQQILLRIPCDLPNFHERLMEAFYYSPRRGQISQLYTADVIEEIFKQDPLTTSTGSFEGGRIQLLIGQAVADPNPARGREALIEILGEMEHGFRVERLDPLFEKYRYGEGLEVIFHDRTSAEFRQRHRADAEAALREYRPMDRPLLNNFIFDMAPNDPSRAREMYQIFHSGMRNYAKTQVHTALDFARIHGQGQLVLRRILNIFSVGDVPAKLAELQVEGNPGDTYHYLRQLMRQGHPPEQLVTAIQGTRHTAYLSDPRLARKVVSVMLEAGPYLFEKAGEREENLQRLRRVFWDWARSGREFSTESFIAGMQANPTPKSESILSAYTQGKFRVEILPGQEFERRAEELGMVPECQISFMREGRKGEVPVIYIRAMPRLISTGPFIPDDPDAIDLRSPDGPQRAFREYAIRLLYKRHEEEHWAHFTGNYEGLEAGGQPILLRTREERLVSETMALLEEFSWASRNLHLNLWEYSRRLGQGLPVYLRNFSDQSYFGRDNDRRAEELVRYFSKENSE